MLVAPEFLTGTNIAYVIAGSNGIAAMKDGGEVIALVLDEEQDADSNDAIETTGAQRLIREADGSVALEPVETQEDFERIAKDTGCFRRGRAIRDPQSREIIGYEMEEVSPLLTIASG